MAEDTATRQGYIVIADIAGYTKFLTGTELEHAQGIIGELTHLIIERLAPPLTFVKLEGDAVLCYADASRFTAPGAPRRDRRIVLRRVLGPPARHAAQHHLPLRRLRHHG